MRKHAAFGWVFGLSLLTLLGSSAAARADDNSDSKGWLGIYTQSLTTELREGMDYRGDGVLVTRVVADSPADRAGIAKGDVIVSVNQQSVDSPDRLAEAVATHKSGDEISIHLVRDGETRTVHATLAPRADQDSGPGDVTAPDVPPVPDVPNVPDVPDREQLRRMIHEHMSGGMTTRGRLGVHVGDIDQDSRGDVSVDHGAIVKDVVDDSPAMRAGIRSGDVITSVGGSSIDDSADLIRTLRGKQGHVSIEIDRHGKSHKFDVDLGANTGGGEGMRVYSYQYHPKGPDAGSDQGMSTADRDAMRREIADLRQQIEQLRRELDQLRSEK